MPFNHPTSSKGDTSKEKVTQDIKKPKKDKKDKSDKKAKTERKEG